MRLIPTVLGIAAVLLALPAGAQAPQQPAPGKPEAFTPAPVPGVAPGVPGTAGPGAIPEQVAPPALSAGPANGTPFSGTPSGQLPSDTAIPAARDKVGGSGGATPNLSP